MFKFIFIVPFIIVSANLFSQFCVKCANGVDTIILSAYLSDAKHPIKYKWSNGSTKPIAKVLKAGTYTVTVTDSKGCIIVSKIVIKNCIEIYAYNYHKDVISIASPNRP